MYNKTLLNYDLDFNNPAEVTYGNQGNTASIQETTNSAVGKTLQAGQQGQPQPGLEPAQQGWGTEKKA